MAEVSRETGQERPGWSGRPAVSRGPQAGLGEPRPFRGPAGGGVPVWGRKAATGGGGAGRGAGAGAGAVSLRD